MGWSLGSAGHGPGLVGTVRNRQPVIAVGEVFAHGELQPVLERGLVPQTDHILLRSGGGRVPARLVFGVPQVEVVVVHAHAHEVFGAGLLVELHQVAGIELVALPQPADVLVAEFGGVAVGRNVVLVLRAVLYVDVAGVPVAELRGRLRPPVCPHAELGVAEPLGHAVILQRFGGSVERAPGDFGDGILGRGFARQDQRGRGGEHPEHGAAGDGHGFSIARSGPPRCRLSWGGFSQAKRSWLAAHHAGGLTIRRWSFVHFVEKVGQTIVFRGLSYLARHSQVWL
jgi:hypothetical protein